MTWHVHSYCPNSGPPTPASWTNWPWPRNCTQQQLQPKGGDETCRLKQISAPWVSRTLSLSKPRNPASCLSSERKSDRGYQGLYSPECPSPAVSEIHPAALHTHPGYWLQAVSLGGLRVMLVVLRSCKPCHCSWGPKGRTKASGVCPSPQARAHPSLARPLTWLSCLLRAQPPCWVPPSLGLK